MDYGKAVRIARSARGLNQSELGRKVGRNGSFISRIESGNRTPSLATLEEISKALSVPYFLLMLLGSEDEELDGITPDQAGVLGQSFLTLIRSVEKA